MAKRYLKNENGLVRAISTDNLQLEKPMLNENYDIDVHNRNMDKIDKAIHEVKGQVNGIELTAERVSIADTENLFEATNVEKALQEVITTVNNNKNQANGSIKTIKDSIGQLSELKTTAKNNLVSSINELFQNANNGKNIVATAIGSPLSSADTFATIGSKIDGITNKFKDILQDKGISISSNDKYNSLVDKTSLLTLPKISIVGDDIVLYSRSGYFQAKGSPDESVVYISKELFLRGSIRIKMKADGNQQTASYKIKYRIVNEEGLVKSEKVYTINRNDVLSMTTEFDNIEPYDKVELIYICPTSWQCQSKDLIISCNYA